MLETNAAFGRIADTPTAGSDGGLAFLISRAMGLLKIPFQRATASGDAILRDSEIFVLPDILCNSGGVVASSFEWVQNTQNLSWADVEVNDRLYRILTKAFQEVLQFGKRHTLWKCDAALAIGVQKVIEAKRSRGLYP